VPDRIWLWAAASRQDISFNPGGINPAGLVTPVTMILEPWSAKLHAQISAANSASLYYQRSDELLYGDGARDPARPPEPQTPDLIPTNSYKMQDSNGSSSNLFPPSFAGYRDPASSSPPVGGVDQDTYWSESSFPNSSYFSYSPEPQKQADLQVSRFFNTG